MVPNLSINSCYLCKGKPCFLYHLTDFFISHFKAFFKIAVPSAIPAIVTVVLFSFVWYWNESYLTELYVQGLASKSNWTNLVVQLKNFDQSFNTRAQTGGTATSLNESVRMAATTLSILPLLIMYLILQKQFVESIDKAGITGE